MVWKRVALGAVAVASAVTIGVAAGLVISRARGTAGARVSTADARVSTADERVSAADDPTTTRVTRAAGPKRTASPPATDVRRVDWNSLTYVVEEQGGDVELRPTTDESAEMGWAMGGQTFGDLDGDGQDDALVELYNIGPSVRPAAAFVILASDPQPAGLATRRVQYPVFPSGNTQEVTINGRQLRLRAEDNGLGGSNGSPPNDVEATYELRDGELVELSRTSTPKPDSIEGRFDAMVEAYLAKDSAGVEALLGDGVERLGDPASWSSDLDDPSCREGEDTTQVVCGLSPQGQQQVMITIDRFDGEVLDVFVGGGL